MNDVLGGWCVSSTQKASVVSAISWPCHLIWMCRLVRSTRGGRGKDCTLSFRGGAAMEFMVAGLEWSGRAGGGSGGSGSGGGGCFGC